jgi:hypothetical protein
LELCDADRARLYYENARELLKLPALGTAQG